MLHDRAGGRDWSLPRLFYNQSMGKEGRVSPYVFKILHSRARPKRWNGQAATTAVPRQGLDTQ